MIGKMDIRCKSMKASELISIIMPVQDTEQYLPQCLDSMIAQTEAHWELIAVNDHSKDGSFDVLAAYAIKDPRITVLNSTGHNIIAALQTGYAASKGVFICRMDSDDIMHPRKLELLRSKLESAQPKTVAAGSVRYFTDNGAIGDGYARYAKWLNTIAKNGLYWSELYKECILPSCCWMMRRNEFEEVGGFDSISYPEDYDFCFRLYQSGYRVDGLEEEIHFWRDREDRASRTKEQYADNRFLALKTHYFHKLDRDSSKTLILWGAGRNGKDLSKELSSKDIDFLWISNNAKKIGKHIYDTEIQSDTMIEDVSKFQLIVAVSNESEKSDIKQLLESKGLIQAKDFWFFL